MQKPDVDIQFFTEHPDRKYRIRVPLKQMVIDKQRGSHVVDECEREFQSLGDHRRDRRRIIALRGDHRGAQTMYEGKNVILKIPLLLFGDEEVADDDSTLAPIVFEIMNAASDAQTRGF